MSIFGVGPSDNDDSIDEIGAVFFLIKERLKERFEIMNRHESGEQCAVALISSLRVLAEAFPVSASIMIDEDDIEDWRGLFSEWFSAKKGLIPDNFQDGIWNTFLEEMNLLESAID